MTWSHEQAAALSSVFDALTQSEIQWIVLRNYEGLPESNRSKDIDLGCAKKDIERATRLIANALTAHGFDRRFTEDFQYVRCFTFFNMTGDDVLSIKIDLLDGFVWRGAQLFDFSQIYASRISYRNFFVPDAVDDGVMLWIKPLLTGGFVKERYIDDILRVSKHSPERFRERLCVVFGESIVGEIWPFIEQGQLEKTVPFQRRLAWAGWRQAARREPRRTLTASLAHAFYEVIRRSKRNPASLLAVVGPDGVGKTTFINALQQELARLLVKDISDIQVLHFRPRILPNIKELLSGRAYDVSSEEFGKPHRAAPASPPSSLARLAYYWADYVLGYWLAIRRKCARGTAIIFDRYFYDFIVDPRRSRLNLPGWVRGAFLCLTPQPDIVFFLDCDPDTVYARKQELAKPEIERQLCEYRKLAKSDPDRFVCLNALETPAVSCRKALKELVARSFDRT